MSVLLDHSLFILLRISFLCVSKIINMSYLLGCFAGHLSSAAYSPALMYSHNRGLLLLILPIGQNQQISFFRLTMTTPYLSTVSFGFRAVNMTGVNSHV